MAFLTRSFDKGERRIDLYSNIYLSHCPRIFSDKVQSSLFSRIWNNCASILSVKAFL